MSGIAIILSTTKGGLQAVANAANATLIEGTEHLFTSMTTFSDPQMTPAGYIVTGKKGWIALAQRN